MMEWRGHDVRCLADHFDIANTLRPDSNVRALASGSSFTGGHYITGYLGKLAIPG